MPGVLIEDSKNVEVSASHFRTEFERRSTINPVDFSPRKPLASPQTLSYFHRL
jgi:hypothetical protein